MNPHSLTYEDSDLTFGLLRDIIGIADRTIIKEEYIILVRQSNLGFLPNQTPYQLGYTPIVSFPLPSFNLYSAVLAKFKL